MYDGENLVQKIEYGWIPQNVKLVHVLVHSIVKQKKYRKKKCSNANPTNTNLQPENQNEDIESMFVDKTASDVNEVPKSMGNADTL